MVYRQCRIIPAQRSHTAQFNVKWVNIFNKKLNNLVFSVLYREVEVKIYMLYFFIKQMQFFIRLFSFVYLPFSGSLLEFTKNSRGDYGRIIGNW